MKSSWINPQLKPPAPQKKSTTLKIFFVSLLFLIIFLLLGSNLSNKFPISFLYLILKFIAEINF